MSRRYEHREVSSRNLQDELDAIGGMGGELHTVTRGSAYVDLGHHLQWWHLFIDWEPNKLTERASGESGSETE